MKKVWDGRGEESHKYFIRFSKGVFENRGMLNVMRTKKLKLKGSFEWCNDFAELVSEIADVNFSGTILSKEELPEFSGKNTRGMFKYEVSDVSSAKVQELKDKVYFFLLNCESESISLKCKKKLPKPGKSANKIDDKFCSLEIDLKYWDKVKDIFMLPECKRAKIAHDVHVEEIVMPETTEKDFAKIREMAQKKGRIIKKMEIDKVESKEEKEFLA